MQEELYTDGVDEVMISGTIVRVDLFSLSPTERDANNFPKKVFRQRLIFSAEGFANSVEVMQNALQGLVDAGVVKRNQPRGVTANPETGSGGERGNSPTSSAQRAPNASTNFR
ncbi:hypothetical protein V1291_004100 [Nitrobacteraceae bacterium AZCC 1564]